MTNIGIGDPGKIEQAAEMLVQSERPMLHAGSGVSWSGAWEEFMALGEYLGAGFTTSLAARGIVPEDHPRYFAPLNREALEMVRADADVNLVVGGRLGELDGWGKEPCGATPASKAQIQIDVDPTAIGLNRPVDLAILGDAKAVLNALLDAVKAKTDARAPHEGFERYAELTAEWRTELELAMDYGSGKINSGRMINTVRNFFPRDAIMAQDGGNTSLWCANYNPIYEPHSYLYTAKFGHLGTGIPYAIGAKLANPDRDVLLSSPATARWASTSRRWKPPGATTSTLT